MAALESLKQNTGDEVKRMLERYEDRARRGLIEKTEMDRAFGVVDKAIKGTKDRLKDPVFLKSLTPEDFAKLSNAWHAWGSEKLFPDEAQRRELASVLIQDKGNKKKDRALEYARQIWRTEMTATLVKHLAEDSSKSDPEKSRVVERMMASQIVDKGEDSASEALMISMRLDGAILDKGTRAEIAKQMEASPYKVTTKGDFSQCLNALGGLSRELKDERHVSRFRITVGGELLDIPENMRESLMLKNVAFIGDRIYAQMGNGCEGNLVIIDLVPGPKPEPVPEPEPEPNPNPVPPGPGPRPQPGPTEGLDDRYILTDGERSRLVPILRDWHEHGDVALFSKELLSNYSTLGIEPVLMVMDALDPAEQELVMGEMLATLGTTNPVDAKRFMQEIMDNVSHGLRGTLVAQFDDLIAEPGNNPSTKALWELEKALFLGQAESTNPDLTRDLLDRIDSINRADLTPELQEMYDSNKKTIEFFVKRPLALDMVDSALGVTETTFTDGEALDELVALSPTELSDALANEGVLEVFDSDAEVFLASMHVLEVLRLALTYEYPKDFLNGVDIKNPVEYYYGKIKDGSLSVISIPTPPSGGGVESVTDPLGHGVSYPSGGNFDVHTFFSNREAEIELFEQYQSGSESLGTNGWTSGFEGDAGAFMGEEHSAGGIISGSKDILEGPLFEKGGQLGGVERLYVHKCQELLRSGRYDEARALIVEQLEDKLAKEKVLTPAEESARYAKLEGELLNPLVAQAMLEMENKGITTAMVAGQPRPSGGVYSSLGEVASDMASAQIRNRAHLELQGEIGETIFDRYANNLDRLDTSRMSADGYSVFEMTLLGRLGELNGYGNFDFQEEGVDWVTSKAKILAEILAVELAIMSGVGLMTGVAAGLAGAGTATAATVAAVGTGAEVAGAGARLFNQGGRVFRAGVAGGEWLSATRAVRATSGLVARVPGATRAGGYGARAMGWVGEGASWQARGVRTLAHSTAFVEGTSLLNSATFIDPTSQEGMYAIGATAVTMYGLGKMQQLTRGQLGASRFAGEVRAGTRTVSRFNLPARAYNGLGEASLLLRRGNRMLRSAGTPGFMAANAAEIGVEMAAMYHLADAEQEFAVFLNEKVSEDMGMSRLEREATRDPNFWRRVAGDFVMVAGLRTYGSKYKRKQATPGGKEPLLLTTSGEPLEPWAIQDGVREVGQGKAPGFDSYGRFSESSGRYSGPKGERTEIGPNPPTPFEPTLNIPNDGMNYPMTRWEAPQTGLQTIPAKPRHWVDTRESRVEADVQTPSVDTSRYSGPTVEKTVIDPNRPAPFEPNLNIPNDAMNYPMTRWEAPRQSRQEAGAETNKVVEPTAPAEPVSGAPFKGTQTPSIRVERGNGRFDVGGADVTPSSVPNNSSDQGVRPARGGRMRL